MTIALIQLLLTIYFVYLNVKIDSTILNSGWFITNHNPRWWIRAIGVFVISWFSLIDCFALGLVFFALFNPWLNSSRDLDLGFWYVGTEADTDKFFRKYPALYKIVLVSSLIVGITLHIYLAL